MSVRIRTAFTLVELLVAIAIIAMLVTLFLPAVQPALEAARRVRCIHSPKQLGLPSLNYHAAQDIFPVFVVVEDDGLANVKLSWIK